MMQASTSRSVITPIKTASRLLPCTRGRRMRPFSNSAVIADQETANPGAEAAGPSFPPFPRPSNVPKGVLAKQLHAESRRHVYLEGLSDSVIPADIRRFAQRKLGMDERTTRQLGVVMLPGTRLSSRGCFLIEFDNSTTAWRFVDRIRGRSGPGDPSSIVKARLIDPARYPMPEKLQERYPLSVPRAFARSSLAGGAAPVNMAITNEWSGRAVRLFGFPAAISVLHIFEQTKRDGFDIMRGPTLSQGDGRLTDIIEIPSNSNIERTSSWSMYLLRLPSIAEAHRMVRLYNGTWPEWGAMKGEWRIQAEIVW